MPQDNRGEQHAGGHAHLRERAEEPAAVGGCMFDGEQRGAAPFASGGEPLKNAQENQQDRGRDADLGIARQESDGDGGAAHQEQCQHQHGPAAEAVTQMPGDDGTQRTEDEADADGCEGGERGIGGPERLEEQLAEDQRRRIRVNEEVVPLNGGTDHRSCDDAAVFAAHG